MDHAAQLLHAFDFRAIQAQDHVVLFDAGFARWSILIDHGHFHALFIFQVERAQAVGLLNRAARSRELTALTAHEVVIDSDELQIPVRIERKQVVDGLISEYRRAA